MEDNANEIARSPDLASLSVESLLSVPLRYIFRETQTRDRGGGDGGINGTATGGNRAAASFIFSKSECATLLRVSMASNGRIVFPMLFHLT